MMDFLHLWHFGSACPSTGNPVAAPVCVRRLDVLGSLVALGIALAGCSTNPETGVQELVFVDAEEEAAIGALAHPRILKAYGGAYGENGIDAYVVSLVQRIAASSAQPERRYTVTVLDSPVANAFSLPGDYIYVTRGLLAMANDEAELAGVLAHEMGHVNARHAAQRRTASAGTSILGALAGVFLGKTVVDGVLSQGAKGLLAGYSRAQEREADLLAVGYLAQAGYDALAVRDFLQSMSNYAAFQARQLGEAYDAGQVGWLSSHPAFGDRVTDAAGYAARAMPGAPAAERATERFHGAIDGLLYGESREDGYIRGRDFIQVEARYRFQVPQNFQLANTRDGVWAIGPDKIIVKFDVSRKEPDQEIAAYLTDEWAAALALQDVRVFEIDGLASSSARTRVRGLVTQVVAIEAAPDLVYRFLVGVPPQVGTKYDLAIADMVESFQLMSVAEAASIKSLRLRVVPVRVGVSDEDLSRRIAFGEHRLERFRLLNAVSSSAPLRVGQSVKLIVEGD
ncbi:MAG: peptidase M48 [Rhodobiaceae bacterium]|nr:MAG: peptidase M48 [Rhodobiaceae bacterium]